MIPATNRTSLFEASRPSDARAMPRKRRLAGAAVLALVCWAARQPPAAAQEAEAARPEVAKPLSAAEAAIRAKQFEQAQVQIGKAEAVKGRSAYETFLIEQTAGVLAQAKGDTDEALKDFKELLASGRLPASERPRMEQTIAGLQFQKQDYAGAAESIKAAIKDGNKDPTLTPELAQAYYQGGDYKNAAALTQQQIDAEKKAGKPPAEAQLQMLASCAQKQNDDAGFAAALEQLAINYPTPDVWGNLVNRLQRKPGVASHYALDLARLKLKLGLVTTPADYEEAAQLALADGYPGEATSIINEGFDKKILGAAADAVRQQRLRDYAAKQLAADKDGLAQRKADAADAHDGKDLVRVGYDLATQGDASGTALIEQGIKKGGLARPDAAKLLLAQAYLKAGRTNDAINTFKTVGGEGTSDIAHLWVLALTTKAHA